ncbi:branched-chain amino acid ABC transporter permease [Pontibaca methylaminivorans]|uniref:Branched-chain amino acid transport system permease protein n=1 Tax=Pontibaca methylaminivorans TaxID=515897 RepID=A0A1R3WPJ0_9RHOB|nr:branched-chain amino acid ABC transporter permease [Pontibaca methylaminivorans]SIT80124.1 branched-chain amino acid transport system permease protein [Pontibaca methylaminivorans]
MTRPSLTQINWHNPLTPWGAKTTDIPTIAAPDCSEVWDANTEYKAKTYKVGRLKHYIIWPNHGQKIWDRLRWWPTRRNLLHVRGIYNRKTLAAEKKILDRRPVYWALCLLLIALGPFLFPGAMYNTLLSAGTIFCIFAAVNVCWTLILGTASIFSLATYAVVGVSAFVTTYASIQIGLPWFTLPILGGFLGLAMGGLIAIPALRLDGFYYALLTLGLNELCRVFFTTSKQFGSASGGLYGADSFLPASWSPAAQSLLSYYSAFGLLIAALFLFRFINGKRLGRILRMAPEKREAFAATCGVDYRTARITIFVVTSAALGFIGGFYATLYGGTAFSIFSFETVLLGLAMVTIGGIGKAEGAILGTLVVTFLDRVLISWGPTRMFLIGIIMLAVVLFLNTGYFGIKKQFNAWRDKKRGEWRSMRTEKGGEALPEEATEQDDKDVLYFLRFDKMQRDYLKTLICPEIIEEHRRQPLGQHSAALERLLMYFRRAPMDDKYALHRNSATGKFKIIAFSGERGVSPRVVEDREYDSIGDGYHAIFMRRVHDLLES